MPDQPNGAAPVAEAPPEKPKPKPCLYCRKTRCMDPSNFTIPTGESARVAGCWRGPICDDCRQRAAEGDIQRTWESPPDPESKRAVSITVADADAAILRILSWTSALPNLKWLDFRRGTNALRDYRLSPKDAEDFSNKKFALADCGFTDDRYFELSNLNEYERALTNAESVGLQSGVLRACMGRRKRFFTEFAVDEIEDVVVPPEPEKLSPESNEAKWIALAAQFAETKSWPESEDREQQKEFLRLTALFSTECIMDEARSTLGPRIVAQAKVLIAAREMMREIEKRGG